MDWQFTKTLKINQEMSIRPGSHTWLLNSNSRSVIQKFYKKTKHKKTKQPKNNIHTSVSTTFHLKACSYALSRPLGAQISVMGGISNALARHMSTTHHHMLGCPRHLLKTRHSPPTLGPRRTPITQSDIHMCTWHVGYSYIFIYMDMPTFQSQQTCSHLRNLQAASRKARSREQESQICLMTEKVDSPDLSYI